MSGIMKVFLLIAVMFCISEAQSNGKGKQCLCDKVKNRIISRTAIKEIQMYQANVFCTKDELVVTHKNGFRYCLNTEVQPGKAIKETMINKQRFSTASPSDRTSTSGGSSTATN